jgi:hypothetical protein
MMKPFQIETWALRVIEQVQKQQPIEDSLVELKSEWISADKAARRIAAHANAARGDPILWIIGLDEKLGVTGAAHTDLATWWPQVMKEFNEVTPSVMDVVVTAPGQAPVVALQFDTSRYPFVVRNVAGGAVTFEVPWRAGTSVRSAARSEIMAMLSGLVRVPEVKILSARLDATSFLPAPNKARKLEWRLSADIYITPHDEVVIPLHTGEITMSPDGGNTRIEGGEIDLHPRVVYPGSINYRPGNPSGLDSFTMLSTSSELIVRGAGLAELTARFETGLVERHQLEVPILVEASFTPARASNRIALTLDLVPNPSGIPQGGVMSHRLRQGNK